jgi:SAM-dependent methyltransferase
MNNPHGVRRIPLARKAHERLYAAATSLKGLGRLIRDMVVFRRRARDLPFLCRWRDLYPCLGEDTGTAGFDRHYTFHTAWAARILAQTRPPLHHDISSAIYFSTLVSAFIPVHFYDYRPARLPLSGLTSGKADLLRLPFASNSLVSLSCMHVVEHVGLGRYGDRLDPEGSFKAIAEIKRVIAPGGTLLFVTPIGAQPRVQFNAHRIFSLKLVQECFADLFDLREFALIPDDPDDGDLVVSPPQELTDRQYYGCGCFWLQKKALQ